MADTLPGSQFDKGVANAAVPVTAKDSSTWLRAAGASVLTLVVLVIAFFYVPQWILTKLSSPGRAGRAWIATAWMGIAFGFACYSAWRWTGQSTHTD